jgi:ferredoxin-NADP reductase
MKAILDHTQQEASNITTFFFRPERPLRYIAGQYIEMTLQHDQPDDRGVRRWFTLSSAPGHEHITITTKHAEKSSTFKSHLWALQPGDAVEISEPMGDFVLPKDETQPLVFVAGGIGITPFHSIVQSLIDAGQSRQIQFLYSVHSADEIVFKDTFAQPFIEVQELVGQPNLTAQEIIKKVGGIDGKQVFISGPEPMTEAIVDQFKELGITQDQLITDYFPGYPA